MAYIYDLADVWASAGTTFTAIKMNVTDTASNAASLLMDLQVGGVTRVSVSKGGSILSPLNSGLVPALATSAANDRGFGFYQNRPSILYGGTVALSMPNALTIGLNSTTTIGWGAGNPIDSTIDTVLARDAANTLGQRNGVNPQAFNLYNTYTDASNYERGFMRFVSNTLRIGTEKLGTGTARALELHTDGVARLTLATTGEASFAGRISAVSNSLSYSAPTYGFGSCGISATVSNPIIYFHAPSYGFLALAQTSVAINGSMSLGFYAADPSNTSVDAAFARDAADTIAQRRGTNAQTSRLYGTYTDASNYRRLTKTMSTAGVAEIKPEGAGTGASGNVLHISGLPTSNPGPGILWNNAGTPAIGT